MFSHARLINTFESCHPIESSENVKYVEDELDLKSYLYSLYKCRNIISKWIKQNDEGRIHLQHWFPKRGVQVSYLLGEESPKGSEIPCSFDK